MGKGQPHQGGEAALGEGHSGEGGTGLRMGSLCLGKGKELEKMTG